VGVEKGVVTVGVEKGVEKGVVMVGMEKGVVMVGVEKGVVMVGVEKGAEGDLEVVKVEGERVMGGEKGVEAVVGAQGCKLPASTDCYH